MGRAGGGPVGGHGDGVVALRSGHSGVAGRGATAAPAETARWESIGREFSATEIVGQHRRGDVADLVGRRWGSSEGGGGKRVLRQVHRRDVHWRHGLGH